MYCFLVCLIDWFVGDAMIVDLICKLIVFGFWSSGKHMYVLFLVCGCMKNLNNNKKT